jgi:glycosyltransferase involved in cell wall biosynthesis
MDYAQGDFLAFIDSDDWIAPQMFETLVQYALMYQADIVVCGHFIVDKNSVESIHDDGTLDVLSKDRALDLILEDREINSFACDKLYRRNLFKDIRYPLGRIFEDTATTYKLFNIANLVVRINIPFYYYIRRSGSLCLADNPVRNYHNFLAFFERFEFTRYNALNTQKICLEYAINQAVCTIDNYALASDNDRKVVPINDILEKVIILCKEKKSLMKSIPEGKLCLFSLSFKLYFILYKIFHSFKKSLS